VVLDKTGTVTRGKPELQEIITFTDLSEDRLLQIAASLENNSEHPLAMAVVNAAELKGISLIGNSNFIAVPGKGIQGRISGESYLLGTEDFMVSHGIKIDQVRSKKSVLESEGRTVMILSVKSEKDGNSLPIGLISVADSIKDHSAEGIKLLKDLGLNVFMITGDNHRTAKAIAHTSGIENILAGVLPEGKAEEIRKLQESGRIIAMVGDGVNDAPALALADIGIAMGEGSDIAMESADVTLMRGDLREISAAILISRKTMGKIRQNLFWAFFYNSVGIPFAALGFLNPVIAGAAMAFSSVSVVSNSLSLKKFKISRKFDKNSVKDKNKAAIIKVEGMTCKHCKMSVEKAALNLESVKEAVVDLDRKELT
ncbi:MAG: metal-transporting ATPase, partial [Spirochaetales bacterium]|nr:metal-transporting ATPase [Spirochaetales bacterium]